MINNDCDIYKVINNLDGRTATVEQTIYGNIEMLEKRIKYLEDKLSKIESYLPDSTKLALELDDEQ